MMYEHQLYPSKPYTFERYVEHAELARTTLTEYLLDCGLNVERIKQVLWLVDEEEKWMAMADEEALS